MGWFFNTWSDIVRVLVLGIAGYIALIFFLRVSGKRTLSKLNAFDFVITVALGSTFGSFILSKDISLSEGLTGLAVLIWLQHMISWLTVRSDFIKGVVRGEPTLVYYNGEYLKDAMKRSRVVESEIEQSVRNEGHANLEDVGAVILETDGSFSIIGQSEKEGKELKITGLKV
ncbi:MAG: YetF domain-containing protein [Methanosarcina mazei]|uniref:Membrane protein n=3 Tax=Methanosarcina mazei TaxID=2209 RepID=A0A0F8MMQ0_METMZ|nr:MULTISPECIES: YetF domain-containing protein [Methanosarcina]AKB64622.1 hypothetical protein MSMAS_1426 [Methanosarcina mazei S-6]AKB68368.1 hypothetical protein MSMAL_1825 [Methanosarcina mazei LYC]KKH29775.1 membrane protein [Methanosarcina mazei]NLO30930.1 DUF421 domain-containing protein [Methanosarcina mazei]